MKNILSDKNSKGYTLIGSLIVGLVIIAVSTLKLYQNYKETKDLIYGLGVITDYSSTLSSSITSSQATIPVSSVTDRGGTSITFSSSTFGDAVWFNLEPGTSRSEVVRCASLSGSIWGSCTRGLPFGATGCNNTASTTLQQAHNAGSRVVMTNVCQVYSELLAKDTPQTARAALTIQSGGITLGNGSTTTTNSNGITIANGTSNNPVLMRYNESGDFVEFSDDGVTFSRPVSTSSVADGGRGILRETFGGTATSSVFQTSTGTPSNNNGGAGAGGLEFFNCRGAIPTCDVRVATSSTSPLVLEFGSSGGLLSVSSTYFIGHANGPWGWTSSTFVIDADNDGGTSASTSLAFNQGTTREDRLLAVSNNGDFVLGDRAGTNYLVLNSSEIVPYLTIRPRDNNARDLGAAGLAWRNVYVSSSVLLGVTGVNTSGTLSANFLGFSGASTIDAGGVLSLNTLNNQTVSVGALLQPATNNARALGAFGNAWSNIFASGTLTIGTQTASTTITGGSLFLSGNIQPTTNASSNLGAFGSAFNNVFVSGTLRVDTLSLSGGLNPAGNNNADLGAYGSAWRTLYASTSLIFSNNNSAFGLLHAAHLGFSGAASIDASSTLSINTLNNQTVSVGGLLQPSTNNSRNLGALGNAWGSIFASNTLFIGTSSASTTIYSGIVYTSSDVFSSGTLRVGAGNGVNLTTDGIVVRGSSNASSTLSNNGNFLLTGDVFSSGTLRVGSGNGVNLTTTGVVTNGSSSVSSTISSNGNILLTGDIFSSGTLRVGTGSGVNITTTGVTAAANGSSTVLDSTSITFSGTPSINAQGGTLSINTSGNQIISVGGHIIPNTNNSRDLGTTALQFRAIYARSSSTIPRSHAAGQSTQSTDGSTTSANLTINHNLGIIPAKISITAVQRIYNIAGEGTACCGVASTTASTGVWLNGAAPTVTPGANSSTYSLPLNVGLGGSGGGSTTNTVMIISPTNGRNFARGVVSDVTSSTFVINFTLLSYSDTVLSPIQIQWEAEQ